jgi:hypothetical protein
MRPIMLAIAALLVVVPAGCDWFTRPEEPR